MKSTNITVVLLIFLCCSRSMAEAGDIEGFTQPAETVHVAAPETGIIASLELKQGSMVTAGQVIAVLDTRVLLATLEAARAKAETKGAEMAATAVLRQRQSRRDHMLQLKDNGHASPEELDRAESELEIAQANLMSAQEVAIANRLELKRIEAQVEHRTVRSPIDGVLIDLAKRRGEFLAATDTVVATIVDISKLRVKFHVPTQQVTSLSANQTVMVKIAGSKELANAVVDFVSPITDAESDLVRVEVMIDNAQGQHRSGVRCFLQHNGSQNETYRSTSRILHIDRTNKEFR